jgi:hypothetical protein
VIKLRINNDYNDLPPIIIHKTKKAKAIQKKEAKVKVSFLKTKDFKYLKIKSDRGDILLKINENNLDLKILSNGKYSKEELKKTLEKKGWIVKSIKFFTKK